MKDIQFIKTKLAKIVLVIFIALGLLFLISGGLIYFTNQSFILKANQVDANIVNVTSVANPNGRRYSAQYEFLTTNNTRELIDAPYIFSYSNDGYKEGEKINLYYNPQNPKQVIVNDYKNIYFLPTTLIVMGIILTSVGGIILFYSRTKKKML
jgi:hypothetical protein